MRQQEDREAGGDQHDNDADQAGHQSERMRLRGKQDRCGDRARSRDQRDRQREDGDVADVVALDGGLRGH